MKDKLIFKSVTEIAELIRTKKVSPVELTKELIQHAKETDQIINVFMTIQEEEALKQAKEAEKEIQDGHYKGMYHGIPIAIKDNIYTTDMPTTMSSKIHENYTPNYEATVVQKLKDAGAIIFGKVSMHEYAWGITNDNPHYGPVKNPWKLEHIPGGSSGGSGAAVAAHATLASLGTDTAGSIRIPSSACGIVGLKPTFGRVSKYGVYPLAWTLDHVGPMTKTVSDAAGLLNVIAGYDSNDPTSVNTKKEDYLTYTKDSVENLVIGIEEEYYFSNVDSRVEDVVRKNIKLLEEQGAKVKRVKLPTLAYGEWTELVTSLAEAATIHDVHLREQPENLGDDIKALFYVGQLISSIDYLQAQQVRRQIKHDFNKVFEEVDVLIAPTLPVLPPLIGDKKLILNGKEEDVTDQVIRYMGPANLVGLPALSVPGGIVEGLPVGVQIIGPAFEEKRLFVVGEAIEKTRPLKEAVPELFQRNE